MGKISRRHVLTSIGLSAGTGFLAGGYDRLWGSSQGEPRKQNAWTYVRLDPDTVGQEAYRLFPEGACMYGVFASIVNALGGKPGGDQTKTLQLVKAGCR
jgi:hypothetical protein